MTFPNISCCCLGGEHGAERKSSSSSLDFPIRSHIIHAVFSFAVKKIILRHFWENQNVVSPNNFVVEFFFADSVFHSTKMFISFDVAREKRKLPAQVALFFPPGTFLQRNFPSKKHSFNFSFRPPTAFLFYRKNC